MDVAIKEAADSRLRRDRGSELLFVGLPVQFSERNEKRTK